jgi:hypothetical protein
LILSGVWSEKLRSRAWFIMKGLPLVNFTNECTLFVSEEKKHVSS